MLFLDETETLIQTVAGLHGNRCQTHTHNQPHYYNRVWPSWTSVSFSDARWGIRFLILAAFCTGTSHPPAGLCQAMRGRHAAPQVLAASGA